MTHPPSEVAAAIAGAIRGIPDFPIPGVMFRDITPLLGDAKLFRAATDELASRFADTGVTMVVAIESRGFILGAPVAQALGVGLVPVRKTGKLPHTTRSVEYSLEYGTAALEMHLDALRPGDRVLVVDDVLATGGTALATCELVEVAGAEVVGLGFLLALDDLPGIAALSGRHTEVLVTF